MQITLPEFCLVLLVGATGAGKTSFARKHFSPTEVVSSDHCRAMITDDENNQTVTEEAFEILNLIVEKRLQHRKLTVIDATNVLPKSRQLFLKMAKRNYAGIVLIVLDLPKAILEARLAARTDRHFGANVIEEHQQALTAFLEDVKREGFRKIYRLQTPEAIENVTIIRNKMPSNQTVDKNAFDIIGDVHGCADELKTLLLKMGYTIETGEAFPYGYLVTPPAGRKAFFVGDLTDRGPDSPTVLRIVISMVEMKTALCVCGNHDDKLRRALEGNKVNTAHGLAATLEQLAKEPPAFSEAVLAFLKKLAPHYMLHKGKLAVAHAGIKETMQGKQSGNVRSFCLYGDTTGKYDRFGMPIRLDWAADYSGKALVVYGHTPQHKAIFRNNTINIDTGCVFGGKLTALRYPERVLEEVQAKTLYCQPSRPFIPESEQLKLS